MKIESSSVDISMYGVGAATGEPRVLFSTKAEADAARRPAEYVIEYMLGFVHSEVVTWPAAVSIDLGGEE